MSGHTFQLGWNPERAALARARLVQTGRYCTVTPGRGPKQPALSLSRCRLAHYEQGNAGTCWVHAAKQVFEVTSNALGYHSFPACRRLIGYAGKQLEDGGNPSNGGSVSDAILSMTFDRGVGVAHESLCPYTDDREVLGTKPPQAVYDDARGSHLSLPVDVANLDQVISLLDVGKATGIGIWWPFGWDNPQTIMTDIGRGTYGHALTIIGYSTPGVLSSEACFQIDNWHGLIYPPLAPGRAARVPGYVPITPTKTSDFWVARSTLERVIGHGNAELVSATDFDGLDSLVQRFNFDNTFLA